jgi:catechol 2,3-dioxygenase-like lactoylglutathione lyase family enzyme
MLSDFTPVTTLPVRDLEAAKQFYEGKLGLVAERGGPDGFFFTSGTGSFYLYQSQFAGTNQGTAMSFQIPADAFDTEVDALRSVGVVFETFDAPGLTWTDGVAAMGDGLRSAWFKDPDGNFLNLETSPDVS